MALDAYKRKRNFRSTPEPSGEEKSKKARATPSRRFVIQLHAATQLHYDLRLEIDGTMKSWAVPKGPSLNPLDRRLAVAVEDHPVAYCDFEGLIPAGNYGAGTVMIWDEGTFTARGIDVLAKDGDDELRRGFARGHLTVVLAGQKLQGEFALIRLKKGGEQNWLLLKKHDQYALREDVTALDRSARSGRSLAQIAATATGEGKIWLPQRPPAKARTKAGKKPAASAPRRSGEAPKLPPRLTRGALPGALGASTILSRWQAVGQAPSDIPLAYHAVLDGYRAQLVVDDQGAALYSAAKTPWSTRFPALVKAAAKLGRPLHLDGIIVPLDQNGRPRGRGRGALDAPATYVFYAYDLLLVDDLDLTVLTLNRRLAILASLSLPSTTVRLAAALADAATPLPHGLLLRPLDRVYAAGAGSCLLLRGGRTLSLRRSPLATVAAIASPAAVDRTAQQGESLYAVLHLAVPKAPVRVPPPTNLGKIFWPILRYTKADLLTYYREVAPLLLPHLRDRPQSLHRHPNGIDAPSFFQKEVSGLIPNWIHTATLASGRSGKTTTYALCQDEATLLHLANLGCIELNPWLSRTTAINEPDFVVFDLDPEDVAFSAVVQTARCIYRLLAAIGVASFCKTTGGRGLHIYMPIAPGASYGGSRAFAELLSREVHRQLPAITSLERSPARRRQQVYLDYLQNRIGQTTAAVYSVRPRPEAAVSMPLRWSEVKNGLDPKQFTLKNALVRLGRIGELWPATAGRHPHLADCQAALLELLAKPVSHRK